ncbi:MAG: hypothetical protein ABI476_05560 [Oxalobacteraceae bacterium]
MKYSFQLEETRPKMTVRDNWGLPLNLQVCPECEALNSSIASACVKCGHCLPVPETAAGTPIASAATATATATSDIKPEISDLRKSAPAIAAAATLAPSKTTLAPKSAPNLAPKLAPGRPALNLLKTSRLSDAPRKQKLRPVGWLAVLALAAAAAAFFLVPAAFQPLPAIFHAAKEPGKNLAPTTTTPAAPLLTPNAVAAEKKAQTVLPDDRLAGTALIIPQRLEPTPLVPPMEEGVTALNKPVKKQSAQASRKQARILRAAREPASAGAPAAVAQKVPAASATDMRCSEAARALSLCNVN